MYNQGLVSSTIEPDYEKLPNTLDDIKTQYQQVIKYGPSPNMEVLYAWNSHILGTYAFEEDLIPRKMSHFTDALLTAKSIHKSC